MTNPNQKQPNQRQKIITNIVVPIVVALLGATGFWQLIQWFIQNRSDTQACQLKASQIFIGNKVIEVNKSLKVSISADNPDGKPLVYNWKAVYGQMNPNLRARSSESTYTAPPEPVNDTISVEVTSPDCKSAKSSEQISVISPSSLTPLPTKTSMLDTSTLSSNSDSSTLLKLGDKINPMNGHKYFLTNPDTWTGAQEQARKAGGNLVTINNSEEQNWLVSQFFGGSKQFWIGLHESPREGNFVWVSGQPVEFENWAREEPSDKPVLVNHQKEREKFVVMNYKEPGKWNNECSCNGQLIDRDVSVNSTDIQGIVEIESTYTNVPNQAP